MQELFKELFDSLPHVKRIWVDANANAYLHPKQGCEIVEREVKVAAKAVEAPTVSEVVEAVVEDSNRSKKGKHK